MKDTFIGTVLSHDTESKQIFVESNENSNAIVFRYRDIDVEAMDLTKKKYTVSIDFNGIVTMSLPGQTNADNITVIEAKDHPTLSGTVSRCTHEGFYLTLEDGEEVRIKSNDFIELGDNVTLTYNEETVVTALSLTK